MSSGRPKADLVVSGSAEVITCAGTTGDPLGRIRNGAVAIAGERILHVGSADGLSGHVDVTDAIVLDARGGTVAPGFVDCHTHLVFGGSRVDEYVAAVTGRMVDFQRERPVTGILATVALTRAGSVEQLTAEAAPRMQAMFEHGTTTIESKTGYGLTLQDELKMLEVNRRLDADHPVDVVSTFLGAHAAPPGRSSKDYVREVVEQMIPAVAELGFVSFCDVYCDHGYFSAEESRTILEAGLDAGLGAKIHADAYSAAGGAELAAELGATSADHLNHTEVPAMVRLAERGVVGVVMPGLDFAVGHSRPFDAAAMLASGMTIALATDLCPGCWIESQQVVMALAARLYGLPPAEALLATTVNAARAVGLDDRGSLEPGKLADLQIWDVSTYDELAYKIGRNAVTTVVKRGRVYDRSSGDHR